MRALVVLIVALSAPQASAYDSRIGDALIDVRSGLRGSRVDLSQMVQPRWRAGVTLAHGWSPVRIPVGLGLIVGYEHHQRGYAVVPRASLAASMGLLEDSGLGVNAQLSAGLAWYVTRRLGVGLNLAGNFWGDELKPDVTLSLVQRW